MPVTCFLSHRVDYRLPKCKRVFWILLLFSSPHRTSSFKKRFKPWTKDWARTAAPMWKQFWRTTTKQQNNYWVSSSRRFTIKRWQIVNKSLNMRLKSPSSTAKLLNLNQFLLLNDLYDLLFRSSDLLIIYKIW